ncbi:MAG: DUF89 family protein [Candidatus Odinarchaeota archaeon]|nr:DUF89 family protein [Candidatus Odinarchaeota archaeon]
MHVSAECASCTLEFLTKLIRRAVSDEEKQIELIKTMTIELGRIFDLRQNPSLMTNYLLGLLYPKLNIDDPFKELKQESNRIAEKISKVIEDEIFKISDINERLIRGISAAIAGNVIDYGNPRHKVNLDGLHNVYLGILQEGFFIDHTSQFLKSLNAANDILYLGDNAGEVHFDRILVRILKELKKKIYFVVKGGPISNDATIDDARDAQIDKYATVITTGKALLGIDFDNISDELRDLFDSVDLIISKGQANFETLNYFKDRIKKPVVFLLRAKCDPISRHLNVPKGSNLVIFYEPA